MRTVFAIFAALVVSCAPRLTIPPVENAHAPRPTFQHSLAVALEVQCMDTDGYMRPHGRGSGVVAGSFVLTAYHVVDCGAGEAVVLLTFADSTDAIGVVDDTDPRNDIAILSIVGNPMHAAVTVGPAPKIGETVCSVSAIPSRTRKCGEVQPHRPPGIPGGDVTFYAVIEPGNSGSGVWDEHGRLVGITVHGWNCRNGQFCSGGFSSLEKSKFYELLK